MVAALKTLWLSCAPCVTKSHIDAESHEVGSERTFLPLRLELSDGQGCEQHCASDGRTQTASFQRCNAVQTYSAPNSEVQPQR